MPVLLLPYQVYYPLATVAVWWGLALYQIHRDRFRTWTERFFLVGCLGIGGYALADVFFFNLADQGQAILAAEIGFTVLTLAIVFMFLFALVFYTRMRRGYLLTLLPAAGLIAVVWFWLVPPSSALTSLLDMTNPIPPWTGNWDKAAFTLWVIGAAGYAVLAGYFLFRTYREVAQQTTKLRRRMLGLLIVTIISLIMGGFTNIARGYFSTASLPLFSTGLVLPGIVSFVTLSPLSTERFSVAVRRWKASRYDIKAVFVIFTDGTLIGAKVRPGEKVIDQDLFGATLDVIQNFMRTSFPTLRGSLSAIKHGDYTLVMERGRFAYLTIILQGEENDQLRRHMRDVLLRYERDNEGVLKDWRGMPAEAIGTDTMLGSLLEAD